MAKMHNCKNKKVLIIGFGLHGGGRSVFVYLQQQGANIRITDIKTKNALQVSLRGLKNVKGTFGSYSLKDVRWADVCIKNPGVPKNHPLLVYAKKINKLVTTDLSLFQETLGKKFDCIVTGTRGKTTTASLIGHFLRSNNKKVLVLGNNRIPALSQVKKARHARVVLEASSFQVEDASLLSKVSVFTTFYQDHLNRYDTLKKYFDAKACLFKSQSESDYVVLNYDDKRICRMASKLKSTIFYFSLFELPTKFNGVYLCENNFIFQNKKRKVVLFSRKNVGLMGNHNTQNVLAAAAAAICLRVPLRRLGKVIRSFKGVPYRLERIKSVKRRIFYNDTTATSPEAFVAAYKALRDAYPTAILRFIIGGADKRLDFTIVKRVKRDKKVFLYPLAGSATDKLLRSSNFSVIGKPRKNLYQAFQDCWRDSSPGEVISLSPGAASFGMFQHEFDRGDQFTRLVKSVS